MKTNSLVENEKWLSEVSSRTGGIQKAQKGLKYFKGNIVGMVLGLFKTPSLISKLIDHKPADVGYFTSVQVTLNFSLSCQKPAMINPITAIAMRALLIETEPHTNCLDS